MYPTIYKIYGADNSEALYLKLFINALTKVLVTAILTIKLHRHCTSLGMSHNLCFLYFLSTEVMFTSSRKYYELFFLTTAVMSTSSGIYYDLYDLTNEVMFTSSVM